MTDEMFVSKDGTSLQRGKRRAKRTETCRPCLVWHAGARDSAMEGVVLDVTPHGMRVRMLHALPLDSEIKIQMMRDDTFETPFSSPMDGVVVRYNGMPGSEGVTDHGIKLTHKKVRRKASKPIEIKRARPTRSHKTRMHTVDITDRRRSK